MERHLCRRRIEGQLVQAVQQRAAASFEVTRELLQQLKQLRARTQRRASVPHSEHERNNHVWPQAHHPRRRTHLGVAVEAPALLHRPLYFLLQRLIHDRRWCAEVDAAAAQALPTAGNRSDHGWAPPSYSTVQLQVYSRVARGGHRRSVCTGNAARPGTAVGRSGGRHRTQPL